MTIGFTTVDSTNSSVEMCVSMGRTRITQREGHERPTGSLLSHNLT